MATISKIHASKQPHRPHFIREWAEHRGYLKPSELADALPVQRSIVTNWYKGTSPQKPHQLALAALFFPGEDPEERRKAIFRHPDEDWLSRFFAGRKKDDIERIKATLETAFPRKRSAN